MQTSEICESSSDIRTRVNEARNIQLERYKNAGIYFNSQLSASQIKRYCPLGRNEETLMRHAFDNMNLSARAYHRIIKLSRTMADLEGVEKINEEHIGEALQYRNLDRKFWEIY